MARGSIGSAARRQSTPASSPSPCSATISVSVCRVMFGVARMRWIS
jgi:hypothetical protein